MEIPIDNIRPPLGEQAVSKWTPRALTAASSAKLDTIRGLAAWAVMCGHLRTLFFEDFQHLEHRGFLLKAFYFLTGFGHQAVMVFFVLSGFLISGSVMKNLARGQWSTREYAIHRAARLYVVLVPGLFLGLFFDLLGSHLFASSALYSQPLEGLGFGIAQARMTLANFVGNLFFLQTIACPTFGSNAPLWSLANEFYYYILFPAGLFAALAWKSRSLKVALVLTAFFAVVGYFVGAEIFLGFFIWLMGVAVVFGYTHLRVSSSGARAALLVSAGIILIGSLTAARLESSTIAGSDFVVGLTFSIFLFALLELPSVVAPATFARIAQTMAGFSYSLYVLHFPALLFLRACLSPRRRWQPDSLHLLYGATIGIIVLAFAWATSLITEDKTAVARKWFRAALADFGRHAQRV